ncbi:uncharacterized protein LOC134835510 [Culicoides brevitarsis]|uniref:uncharacterized protein LOC134835510 n=1 Tax=Culicoides brevitarsis TaxID=469753 RepID=UPI00307B20D6
MLRIILIISIATVHFVEAAVICVPCEKDYHHPDVDDTQKFFKCANGRSVQFNCPPQTVFNNEINVCAWPHAEGENCGATFREIPIPNNSGSLTESSSSTTAEEPSLQGSQISSTVSSSSTESSSTADPSSSTDSSSSTESSSTADPSSSTDASSSTESSSTADPSSSTDSSSSAVSSSSTDSSSSAVPSSSTESSSTADPSSSTDASSSTESSSTADPSSSTDSSSSASSTDLSSSTDSSSSTESSSPASSTESSSSTDSSSSASSTESSSSTDSSSSTVSSSSTESSSSTVSSSSTDSSSSASSTESSSSTDSSSSTVSSSPSSSTTDEPSLQGSQISEGEDFMAADLVGRRPLNVQVVTSDQYSTTLSPQKTSETPSTTEDDNSGMFARLQTMMESWYQQEAKTLEQQKQEQLASEKSTILGYLDRIELALRNLLANCNLCSKPKEDITPTQPTVTISPIITPMDKSTNFEIPIGRRQVING